MTIVAFDVRPDEEHHFAALTSELEPIRLVNAPLTAATVTEIGDAHAVSVLGSSLPRELLEVLAVQGVRFIGARSVGVDYIDVAAARELGIRVSYAQYAPESVAEYAVMMMLMCLRRIRRIMDRARIQDFSLAGSSGSQLGARTVGIVGTGRIGASIARILTGFGCRVLGYDLYPNDDLRDIIEYVDLPTLLSSSDVVTLHAPATPETLHLIDAEEFALMRQGSVLINCGRGDLVKTEELIANIENGTIGAAALDVVEDDWDVFHHDLRLGMVTHRHLAILRSFPNVIITPHVAFYTDEAVRDMVHCSVTALRSFLDTGTSKLEVR